MRIQYPRLLSVALSPDEPDKPEQDRAVIELRLNLRCQDRHCRKFHYHLIKAQIVEYDLGQSAEWRRIADDLSEPLSGIQHCPRCHRSSLIQTDDLDALYSFLRSTITPRWVEEGIVSSSEAEAGAVAGR